MVSGFGSKNTTGGNSFNLQHLWLLDVLLVEIWGVKQQIWSLLHIFTSCGFRKLTLDEFLDQKPWFWVLAVFKNVSFFKSIFCDLGGQKLPILLFSSADLKNYGFRTSTLIDFLGGQNPEILEFPLVSPCAEVNLDRFLGPKLAILGGGGVSPRMTIFWKSALIDFWVKACHFEVWWVSPFSLLTIFGSQSQ